MTDKLAELTDDIVSALLRCKLSGPSRTLSPKSKSAALFSWGPATSQNRFWRCRRSSLFLSRFASSAEAIAPRS